jgi:hypothetical protein
MAVAIVIIVLLAVMILWQRQRLLRAGDAFGARDDNADDERDPRTR